MDQQVVKLAEETLARYEALTQELSDPNIYSDQRRYAEVAKEHARMRRGAEMSRECLEALEEGREARGLIPAAESVEEGRRADREDPGRTHRPRPERRQGRDPGDKGGRRRRRGGPLCR